MRKITSDAINAFMNEKSFKRDNTEVQYWPANKVSMLILHGNLIATYLHERKMIMLSTWGWNTPTTKDRMNGIPGIRVNTCKSKLYLNGERWENDGHYAIVDMKTRKVFFDNDTHNEFLIERDCK